MGASTTGGHTFRGPMNTGANSPGRAGGSGGGSLGPALARGGEWLSSELPGSGSDSAWVMALLDSYCWRPDYWRPDYLAARLLAIAGRRVLGSMTGRRALLPYAQRSPSPRRRRFCITALA